MFDNAAHLGHVHEAMESMNHSTASKDGIDHCMPIVVGAVFIIVILLGVVAYLLNTWQPKPGVRQKNKKSIKKR